MLESSKTLILNIILNKRKICNQNTKKIRIYAIRYFSKTLIFFVKTYNEIRKTFIKIRTKLKQIINN